MDANRAFYGAIVRRGALQIRVKRAVFRNNGVAEPLEQRGVAWEVEGSW
jgi:hypothetical protein